MDLEKIGQFIAQKRREKNLTQLELASMLHLSEKTISKWECCKGFPEASTVLALCNILEITANELLSGQTLATEQLAEQTEKNILTLLHSKKDYNLKKLSIIVITILTFSIVLFAAILVQFVALPIWVKATVLVVLFLLLFASIFLLCLLTNSMGEFKCKHCGQKFNAKLSAFLGGMHTINKRYLKCPHCNKRSFCSFESYKKQNKLK